MQHKDQRINQNSNAVDLCMSQNYYVFIFFEFKRDLVEILYKKRRLCTKSNLAMDDLTVLLGTTTISE